jgi:trigger factor
MTTTVEATPETQVKPIFLSGIEVLSNTRKKLTIKVPEAEVKAAFTLAVQKIQKDKGVKGFRPGKTPENLIRKFFMDEIRKQAFEKTVEDSYSEAIKNVDFQVVSFPQIDTVDTFDENKSLEYSATVDINPLIDIVGYKELSLVQTITLPEPEKLIQEYIKTTTLKHSPLVKVKEDRNPTENDIVKVILTGFKNGKALKTKIQPFKIRIGEESEPDLQTILKTLKVGETSALFKSQLQLKSQLVNDQLEEPTEYQAKVLGIETQNKVELNDEIAKKEGFENLELLNKYFLDLAQRHINALRTENLRAQVYTKILEQNQFDVPESLIESTIDRAIDQTNQMLPKTQQKDKKNEQMRELHRETATTQVKQVLALGHIARQESITASNDETIREMKLYAASIGINVTQLIQNIGRESIEEFRGKVLIDKVTEKIIELAKVEVKPEAQE